MSRPHLAHEVRDDAVEDGALVAEALLASAEGAEVLSSLGHHVSIELQKQMITPRVSQCSEHRIDCPRRTRNEGKRCEISNQSVNLHFRPEPNPDQAYQTLHFALCSRPLYNYV